MLSVALGRRFGFGDGLVCLCGSVGRWFMLSVALGTVCAVGVVL